MRHLRSDTAEGLTLLKLNSLVNTSGAVINQSIESQYFSSILFPKKLRHPPILFSSFFNPAEGAVTKHYVLNCSTEKILRFQND